MPDSAEPNPADLDVGAVDIATKKGQASCSWRLRTVDREPNTSGPTWSGTATGCGQFGWQLSEVSKPPAKDSD